MSDPFGTYRDQNGQYDRAGLDNLGKDLARSERSLPDLDKMSIVERERIQQSYYNEKNKSSGW